jgi:DNA-3-methyladenine glycosylase
MLGVDKLLTTYPERFYARPTLAVAHDLIGAILCRRTDSGEILTAEIIEDEAYTEEDEACHAFRGKTPRNAVMFGPPGRAYVYFIYGMYFCLNVVTEPAGKPGAILIRALNFENCNGPGKLCREWNITRNENGVNLTDPSGELWISKGKPVKESDIIVTKRIGITQAEAVDRPWRFHLNEHPLVSGRANRKQAKIKVSQKK